MTTVLTPSLSVYYNSTSKDYLGGNTTLHQAALSRQSVHLLDVVLLAYTCLSINSPIGNDFVPAFMELCRRKRRVQELDDGSYSSALYVYVSVKKHIADLFGQVNYNQIPKFSVVNYAYGANKQSLRIIIQPV